MPSRWKPIDSTGQDPFSEAEAKSKNKAVKAHATKKSRTPSEPIELRETFVSRSPIRSLSHLIVPEETRAQIDVLLTKLKYQDTLYHEWNLIELDPHGERTAINLYGPPGTGKTLCAEAIAHRLGKQILDVNYAELESKFVGETAKNIVVAFEAAEDDDAVLFFDEADSILGKRLTDVRQSADYGVNQSRSVMLKQLEDFQGVVIFATNMAKNYDGAFIRRILGHIEFRIPDRKCRQRLWEQFLVPELPLGPAVTAAKLAELTAGLSGGELQNILVATASTAVGREGNERRLKIEDFQRQIQIMRDTKQNVGNYDYGSPAREPTERRIKLGDLPASVKRAASGEARVEKNSEYRVRWSKMPRKFIPIGLRVLDEVAKADQVVRESEREALRAILSFCKYPEAEELWATAREDNVLEDLERLAGTPWAKLILRDAIAIGFSDGHFSQAERRFVEDTAMTLQVPDSFLKKCESWACKGLHWLQRGASLIES